MNEELKTCPFCGGRGAFIQIALSEAWVSCKGCNASSRITSGPISASDAWNTRAESAEIAALLAVAEAVKLLRMLQRRGARDPNEHAMIAAASDKLDRAIGKLEGAKL